MITPDPFTVTYVIARSDRKLRCTVRMRSGDLYIDVPAIWDTGASASCISVLVARTLNLPIRGVTQNYTAGGVVPAQLYYVDLEITDGAVYRDVLVADSDIGSQGLGALIGMDIISTGDFAISTEGDQLFLTFRYPSKQRIDFVRQERLQAQIGTHGKGTKKYRPK